MTDGERLRSEHDDGELTTTLLLFTPAAACSQRILTELLRLDRMIDAETDEARHTELCAAFRSLMWARSPDCFAPPSEA